MRHQSPNPDFQTKRLSLFGGGIFGRRSNMRRPALGQINVPRRAGDVLDAAGNLGKRAATRLICSAVHQNSCAMVEHYFFGNGRRRSLESFNMHTAFRSHTSVQRAVRRFEQMMVGRANRMAFDVCRNSANQDGVVHRRISEMGRFRTSVDNGFRSPLFAIGDGNLDGESNLILEVNCAARTLNLRGELRFTYDDEFKDPADIFDRVDRDLEVPGGRPYDFFDSWTAPLRVTNQRITS